MLIDHAMLIDHDANWNVMMILYTSTYIPFDVNEIYAVYPLTYLDAVSSVNKWLDNR